jgi:hypothetical protein
MRKLTREATLNCCKIVYITQMERFWKVERLKLVRELVIGRTMICITSKYDMDSMEIEVNFTESVEKQIEWMEYECGKRNRSG